MFYVIGLRPVVAINFLKFFARGSVKMPEQPILIIGSDDERRRFSDLRRSFSILGAVIAIGIIAARRLERPSDLEVPVFAPRLSIADFSTGFVSRDFGAAADPRFAGKAQYKAQQNALASRAAAVGQYRSGAIRARHASRENRHAERQRNAAAYRR